MGIAETPDSQGMVPRPGASTLPENVLEMQIVGPQPIPSTSETLGGGAQQPSLTRPPGDSLMFETHWLR